VSWTLMVDSVDDWLDETIFGQKKFKMADASAEQSETAVAVPSDAVPQEEEDMSFDPSLEVCVWFTFPGNPEFFLPRITWGSYPPRS
jgi:hypothetical protein